MGNRVKRAGHNGPRNAGRLAPIVFLILMALIAGYACRAQETPPAPATSAAPSAPAIELPPAEKIIEESIAASGGRETLEKIHSRVTRGSLEIPMAGIKAAISVYTAEPNRVYNVVESDALGKITSGCDGEVYWESLAMTGSRIKEGEEKASAARESRFHGDLEWRSLYKEAKTTELADVGDRKCYKLTMTPSEGKPECFYYGVDDHLLRKIESVVVSPMGEVNVETFVDEYRAQDGVQVPIRSRQVLMGMQEMIFTIESITHNADIPDSVFALPAEIQALLAKPAQESQPTK